MNFVEIKNFQITDESKSFNKMNEGEMTPFELYKTTPMFVDIDRITNIFPHYANDLVTNIDLQGTETGFMIPMSYEKFKEFFLKKQKKEPIEL